MKHSIVTTQANKNVITTYYIRNSIYNGLVTANNKKYKAYYESGIVEYITTYHIDDIIIQLMTDEKFTDVERRDFSNTYVYEIKGDTDIDRDSRTHFSKFIKNVKKQKNEYNLVKYII